MKLSGDDTILWIQARDQHIRNHAFDIGIRVIPSLRPTSVNLPMAVAVVVAKFCGNSCDFFLPWGCGRYSGIIFVLPFSEMHDVWILGVFRACWGSQVCWLWFQDVQICAPPELKFLFLCKVWRDWVWFAVTEVGWSSFLGQRRDMKLKSAPVMTTKRYFPGLRIVSVHNGCVSRSSSYRNLVSINANNRSNVPKWWSSIEKSYPFFSFLFCSFFLWSMCYESWHTWNFQ